jgi:hypothetical protein
VIAGTASAAAAATAGPKPGRELACYTTAKYEELKGRFPRETKQLHETWLDAQFKRPDGVCFYLVDPQFGLESDPQRKARFGEAFVADVRRSAELISWRGKLGGPRACLPNRERTSFAKTFPIAHKVLENFDGFGWQRRSLRGHHCYSLAVLEPLKAWMEKEALDEIGKRVVDPARLAAAHALRFEKAKYVTYESIRAMPGAGRKSPRLTRSFRAAAVSYWAGTDLGRKARVRGCAITGDRWTRRALAGSGRLTAREVFGACAVEVDPGVCVVFFDGCRQAYLGRGRYTGCRYVAFDHARPKRIECAKVR